MLKNLLITLPCSRAISERLAKSPHKEVKAQSPIHYINALRRIKSATSNGKATRKILNLFQIREDKVVVYLRLFVLKKTFLNKCSKNKFNYLNVHLIYSMFTLHKQLASYINYSNAREKYIFERNYS